MWRDKSVLQSGLLFCHHVHQCVFSTLRFKQSFLSILSELSFKFEVTQRYLENFLVKVLKSDHALLAGREEIVKFHLFFILGKLINIVALSEHPKHISHQVFVTSVEKVLGLFIHELISVIKLALLNLRVEDII